MSILETKELRSRLRDQITNNLPDWKPSRQKFDQFPGQDPNQYAHHTFALGTPRTSFDSPLESSKSRRGSAGGRVKTEIRVRWLHRTRMDRQILDEDDAFDSESEALKSLLDVQNTDSIHRDGLHVYAVEQTRRDVGDGLWVLGELVLLADHVISIQ